MSSVSFKKKKKSPFRALNLLALAPRRAVAGRARQNMQPHFLDIVGGHQIKAVVPPENIRAAGAGANRLKKKIQHNQFFFFFFFPTSALWQNLGTK
jgi:hypothetical protein